MPSRSVSASPSVVVIVLDTLRADMMDEPGLLARLPTIQALCDESYVFTRAYAPSHWTLPSHASVFTGLPPSVHLAQTPYMKLREDVRTAAELFREKGYLTACISCNAYLSDLFGMTRGFQVVWNRPLRKVRWLVGEGVTFIPGNRHLGNGFLHSASAIMDAIAGVITTSPMFDNGARAALRRVRRLLRRNSQNLFLLVNLVEAHEPYYSRGKFSSWRKRLQHTDILHHWPELRMAMGGGRLSVSEPVQHAIEEVYWENIRYLDSVLGTLLQGLPGHCLENGYLIIVSDHGQSLGERGLIGHAAGLYQELIHVPLFIRPPGGVEGKRVGHPIDITSLFFLLDAIASNKNDAFSSWLEKVGQEEVILSEAHGGTVPSAQGLIRRNPIHMKDWINFKTTHEHPVIACISGYWKLICHLGRVKDEVYNLEADPREEVNLAASDAEVLQGLHDRLRERFGRTGKKPPSLMRRDALPIAAKREITETVLMRALQDHEKPVLVWTGGKDSTLALYLTLTVARQEGLNSPSLLFVDHGQHFQETWSFMEEIARKEGLEIVVTQNENVLALARDGVDVVPLEALDSENQREALRARLEGAEVPISLGTPVGNHLLKTVALNNALREHGFDGVITGIRWDENPARSSEVFFSPREEPPHTRVHPILPWTERDVWQYTLGNGLPIHPLYNLGYRSFDGVRDSRPTDTRPAWEQDLEASTERAGRAQDKEEIMQQLRALGYF